jgi:hypothetical protein
MIKNAKVKNLGNVILNVVEKNNSDLDLSHIQIDSICSYSLLKRAAEEADKLALIGVNNPRELINNLNLKSYVTIIESNADKVKEFENVDENNIKVLLAETYDLCTDPCFVDKYLKNSPAKDLQEYKLMQSVIEDQKNKNPLVAEKSFDAGILDTYINTLERPLFIKTLEESFRTITKGGKAVIRIYLADEPCNDLLPISMNNLNLKTVPLEKEIIDILDRIGFHGMTFEWRSELPVKVVNGIELREFVLSAYKGKQGLCKDLGQAAIYRGPWKEVFDDDGHRFIRGERIAVCSKTNGVMSSEPYEGQFIYVPCYVDVPEESAPVFDCNTPKVRNIKVSKGIISVNQVNDESSRNSSCDCGCGC